MFLSPYYVCLEDNLWDDLTVGWNPIRTKPLGHRLAPGSIDGLTRIDNLGAFPEAIA